MTAVTWEQIRVILRKRWPEILPVTYLIEKKAIGSPSYAREVDLWLSGERSTVHLRDNIVEYVRYHPQVIRIGQQFNPTTEWDNTWMPLDSAIHMVRHPDEDEVDEMADQRALSAIPTFGMF